MHCVREDLVLLVLTLILDDSVQRVLALAIRGILASCFINISIICCFRKESFGYGSYFSAHLHLCNLRLVFPLYIAMYVLSFNRRFISVTLSCNSCGAFHTWI